MKSPDFPQGAALIWGGSGGIGQSIAQGFAQAGSDVAVVYKTRQARAQSLCQTLCASGVNASAHAADVTQPKQVAAALAEALRVHQRIHTVVFAAGPVVEQVFIAETTEALWRRSFEIEVHGFFHAVQGILPHFRAAGGGCIIHIGSAGHRWWPAKDGLSVAPKAVNEALIKGIAKEEGRFNIRANSVLVGVIEAGMFLELLERGVFDQAWIDETQKLLALKRWGKPEEIAHAAVFLASQKAAYITGESLNVSGGFGV